MDAIDEEWTLRRMDTRFEARGGRVGTRGLTVVFFTLLGTLWATVVWAQSDPYNRIAIEEFEGKGVNPIRAQVIAVLDRKGYDLVGARDIEDASRDLGVRMNYDADYADVARRLQVAAFISGRLFKEGRNWAIEIVIRNGADGRELDRISYRAKRTGALSGVVKTRFWDSARDVLSRAEPPAAGGGGGSGRLPADPRLGGGDPYAGSGSEPVPIEAFDDTTTGGGGDGAHGAEPLTLAFGMGILTRELSYNDVVSGAPRPYDSSVHPTIDLSAALYPAALFTDGPITDLGVAGDFQYVFVSASQTMDGQEFPTSSLGWSVGLNYRLRFSAGQVDFGGRYGSRSFVVENAADGTPKPEIPSVQYAWLAPRLGASVHLAPSFQVMARGEWRFISDSGEFQSADYFPRASVNAFDAVLGVVFDVVPPVRAHLSLEWERYFSNFNSQMGDRFVAGGAVDQFIMANLSVSYALE